jgi:hypothetical protein
MSLFLITCLLVYQAVGLALGSCSVFMTPTGDRIMSSFSCDDDPINKKVIVNTNEYADFSGTCAGEFYQTYFYDYDHCREQHGAYVQNYCTAAKDAPYQFSGLMELNYVVVKGAERNCDALAPHSFSLIATGVCIPKEDYFYSVSCTTTTGTATYRYYSDPQCTQPSTFHLDVIYQYNYNTCEANGSLMSSIYRCFDIEEKKRK